MQGSRLCKLQQNKHDEAGLEAGLGGLEARLGGLEARLEAM